MSVQSTKRPDGTTAYIVRWRENGKHRARTFDDPDLAHRFDIELRHLRQAGELDIVRRAHTFTVADAAADWWTHHVEPNLKQSTVDSYSVLLDERILKKFGHYRLRQVTPLEIEKWIAEMRRKKVGDPTILRTLAVLQGIFKRAERNELINRNPVTLVQKPPQARKRQPPILSPVQVEAIRTQLLKRGETGDGLRHATLVSLLAYSGPRPESEALPLTWGKIRAAGIVYTRTKHRGTRTSERVVGLLDPLRADLAAWRLACGRPGSRQLVFPGHDGEVMNGEAWDRWRDRIFRPACIAAGLPKDTRPRDLRGSFASLLVWEGRTIVEVAAQLGHSPQQCMNSYLGVIADFDPDKRMSANDAIRAARSPVKNARRKRSA